MNTFLEIHIEIPPNYPLTMGHNHKPLQGIKTANMIQVSIHDLSPNNVFWISNQGDLDLEIQSLAMFGHGKDKLKFLGRWTSHDGQRSWNSHWVHAQGRWQLDWTYPTFAWLHRELHYGWLVKPVSTAA